MYNIQKIYEERTDMLGLQLSCILQLFVSTGPGTQDFIATDAVAILRACVSAPFPSGWKLLQLQFHGHALLETGFFLRVRKHTRKYESRQKNIFLTVYPQKNNHRNIMTEKFNCSVCSPSETIFLWVLHAQKNSDSPD